MPSPCQSILGGVDDHVFHTKFRHIELAVEACPYGRKPELYKEDEMPSTTAPYPALVTWNGQNGLPKFDAVKDEDFAPAFEAALYPMNRKSMRLRVIRRHRPSKTP